MQEFYDEATGEVDFAEFDTFLKQARLDVIGFVPGPVVLARTLRVEQQKREPSRRLVSLVLEARPNSADRGNDLEHVDEFAFEALAEQRAIVIYRTTNQDHRMLYGSESFLFDDEEGTRAVSAREIEAALTEAAKAVCASPFTLEAHEDESIPGLAAYSLVVEHTGETFSQEVYYFQARGDDDAIAVALALGQKPTGISGMRDTRRFLYFTGFRGPEHGQVMFECAVPDGNRSAT